MGTPSTTSGWNCTRAVFYEKQMQNVLNMLYVRMKGSNKHDKA